MLLTTRSTVLLTASDTLCRTSAAVPGLLNLLVNFRTSDIVRHELKSTSRVPEGAWACRGIGRSGDSAVVWQPDVSCAEGEPASGSRREAGLPVLLLQMMMMMRGDQRGYNKVRCFTRTHFRFSASKLRKQNVKPKIAKRQRCGFTKRRIYYFFGKYCILAKYSCAIRQYLNKYRYCFIPYFIFLHGNALSKHCDNR